MPFNEEKFKSSVQEAQGESDSIILRAGEIQETLNLNIVSTNLSVANNLQEASVLLMSCNENYKKLLDNHAKSIYKLAKNFEDFDKELSDTM